MNNRWAIREIVKNWLITHGYDGLAGEDCGCEINDLMPCDEPSIYQCRAGHKEKFFWMNEDKPGSYRERNDWVMVEGKAYRDCK